MLIFLENKLKCRKNYTVLFLNKKDFILLLITQNYI